jgi:hypothetical protein
MQIGIEATADKQNFRDNQQTQKYRNCYKRWQCLVRLDVINIVMTEEKLVMGPKGVPGRQS